MRCDDVHAVAKQQHLARRATRRDETRAKTRASARTLNWNRVHAMRNMARACAASEASCAARVQASTRTVAAFYLKEAQPKRATTIERKTRTRRRTTAETVFCRCSICFIIYRVHENVRLASGLKDSTSRASHARPRRSFHPARE